MWKLSLLLLSIALACGVCNAKSAGEPVTNQNFTLTIAGEVRAEPTESTEPPPSTEAPTTPEGPSVSSEPPAETPSISTPKGPSISSEPPTDAFTPSTQPTVRPTDPPITQPPVTLPPVTPASVCLANNNAIGRFPYTNDTECRRYVNCYFQQGVLKAIPLECLTGRYFNRDTQTCETTPPIWCTN